MNKRQLLVAGGIIVLGLLLAYPLSKTFNGPPTAEDQSPAHSIDSPPPIGQANDAGDQQVAASPESRPAVGSKDAQAKPKIVVKTDVFRAGGREVSIGLVLANAEGRSVRLTDVVPTRQPPPSLRIVDEAGQVVAQGSFSYG